MNEAKSTGTHNYRESDRIVFTLYILITFISKQALSNIFTSIIDSVILLTILQSSLCARLARA